MQWPRMTYGWKRGMYLLTITAFTTWLALAPAPAPAAAPPPAIGATTRVSVASDGTQGNDQSNSVSISADGRFVAFNSWASNLVSGDTNHREDVFVHDRQTGQTTLVSVASDGTQDYKDSNEPAISADGRFVAFSSWARNLVSGDTNGTSDIFVHDRQTGQTSRVSVASDGTQGNSGSGASAISADGRFVAFVSDATNLVVPDTNFRVDVFVHDRQTGQTTRVSVASDGTQGNHYSYNPAISADGRFVAFSSLASNLVSGDTNFGLDIFVHDRQTGQTSRVSVASDGTQGNRDSGYTAISADGRFVAFESDATNLVVSDTNHREDVFVHDRQTGQTTRVSVASDGTQGNGGWDSNPAISADGRFVTFDSAASNLVSGDTNSKSDIFVHDRQTGQTSRVSVASDGTQGNSDSVIPAISADGRFVTFASGASILVSGDTNDRIDVFVHDVLPQLPQERSVSTGKGHTCAIQPGGALLCWGMNNAGQIDVPGGAFIQASARWNHTCALRSNGSLLCWGEGDGSSRTPLSGSFTQVSAGYFFGCGLRPDGRLACWGIGSPPDGAFTQVGAGGYHACAVRDDGRVLCWGWNDHGEASPPDGSFTQVSGGDHHTCGVRTDGSVSCWGYNGVGQAPATVAGSFTQVSAGIYTTCGVHTDGTVTCWGSGANGQGSPPWGTYRQVSLGSDHACAVRTDNTLACWGSNTVGHAPVVTVGPGDLPGATAGVVYSQSMSAAGGQPPYTFRVVYRTLPYGLSLGDDSTLSGTPTRAGSSNFTVQAIDARDISGIRAYQIDVAPGPPASIAATGASSWPITVNTTSTVTLQVAVRDAFGNAAPGTRVIFTAPASGPGGTFATGSPAAAGVTLATGGSSAAMVFSDAQGIATAPPFRANGIAGSYTVTATVAGVEQPVRFNLVNEPVRRYLPVAGR